MMNKIYPLEWFDSLISQTLNPKNPLIDKLSKQDLILISEHISFEAKNIQNFLKREIFLLRKKREVRLQVRKYHSNLVYLLDTVIEHQKNETLHAEEKILILELLKSQLEEILLVIEIRFSDYLSLDERVPVTYLMFSRNEIEIRLKQLSLKASEGSIILNLIIKNVIQFLKSFSGKKITYRQLLYQKELLKSIKSIKNIENTEKQCVFSEIDKILIEKNFNSADFVDYIIDQINRETELDDSLTYRITTLLFYQKEIDRMYSNEKLSFDPTRNNIKHVLESWIKKEIYYWERKFEVEIKTSVNDVDFRTTVTTKESKIECDLSADQIALILRAADEARIVKSRSMSYFFKLIVPHLSTPFKRELSYQSVRSKAYNAEDRDKDIAVQTLERIIKKINSY